jgi:hypothetical protein
MISKSNWNGDSMLHQRNRFAGAAKRKNPPAAVKNNRVKFRWFVLAAKYPTCELSVEVSSTYGALASKRNAGQSSSMPEECTM